MSVVSKVDIPLVVGCTLGPFTLGQTLFSTVKTLQWQLPKSRVSVDNDTTPYSDIKITVLEHNCTYVLKFDSALQMLVSISCILSSSERTDYRWIVSSGTIKATLNHDVSIEDIKSLFRKSGIDITNERTIVAYEGVSFLFVPLVTSSKPELTEIRVAPPRDSQLTKLWHPTFSTELISQDFVVPRLQLVIDSNSNVITGVQLTHYQTDQHQIRKIISFADHFQDVVSQLGCADRVYYKDSDHYSHIGSPGRFQQSSLNTTMSVVLNYFYLGLDVVLDSQTYSVTKIILHTNVPDQLEYCSYSRCFFIFSLINTGIAIDRTLDETLFVCPDTNWGVIQSFTKADCCQEIAKCRFGPSTNSNYPFHDTSLYAVSNQMIVETTWYNNIASITLLASTTSVINHSHQRTIYQAHSLLPTKQAEVEIPRCIPIPKLDSSREITTEDDDFYSAVSSLTSDSNAVMESRSESKVSRVQNNRNIKVMAFYGPNVNVIVSSSETSSSIHDSQTRMLVYHFHDVDDLEFSTITSNNYSSVEYTSESLTITSEILEEVPSLTNTPSPGPESSPELNSFDFISHAEMLESQIATFQDGIDSTDTPQFLNGGTDDDVSQLQTSQEEQPVLPPAPEFHYKPKTIATSMYSSRTTVLDEDTNLLTTSVIETSSSDHLIKSKIKGTSSPIVVHKRAGTNLSSKEETMKRLLRHTKSSQQRIKQKHAPTAENVSELQPTENVSTETETKESNDDETATDDNQFESPRTIATNAESTSNYFTSTPSAASLVQVSTIAIASSNDTCASLLEDTPMHQEASGKQFTLSSNLSDDVLQKPVDLHLPPLLTAEENTSTHQLIQSHVTQPQLEKSSKNSIQTDSKSDLDKDNQNGRYNTQLTTDLNVNVTHESCVPSNPRKCWKDDENDALCPEYGPPSMTQERVLLELVACEHEEICTKLKERMKALSLVHQMVINKDTTINLSDHQLEDGVFLSDLLFGLNSRKEWTLQLSAEVITHLKNWFKSDNRKHLLLGSKTVLQICEAHSEVLSSYASGRVTMFTPNELSQCRSICATLSEVATSVTQCLISLQQTSQDSDHEVIQQLCVVKTVIANLFR